MPSATVKVPTALESSLISAVLEHHDGPLNVAWEEVAKNMGYKNSQVASDRFRQVKKKLGWRTGSTANKGSIPSKGRAIKTCAPAKPRATPATARKPAAKETGTTTRQRVAKTKPKFVVESDGEVEEKVKNLTAGSDDKDDEEDSFEEKVNRGDFAEDASNGQLSDRAVALLQREIAEKEAGEPQRQICQQAVEGYCPFDLDAVFESGNEEEFEDAKEHVD